MHPILSTVCLAAGLTAHTAVAFACSGTDLAPGWAPDFKAEVAARANAQPYASGRFFEVTRDGAASVLFGTIHLNDDTVATPPPDLVARITAAEELFVEVTIEEEKRMMRSILLNPSRLLAPSDKRLREQIPAEEWTVLEPLLKGYGITPDMADQVAPWYLTITLANPSCLIAAATSGKAILDRRIEAVAKDAGVDRKSVV